MNQNPNLKPELPAGLWALYKTAICVSKSTSNLDLIADAWKKLADSCDVFLEARKGVNNKDVMRLRDQARRLERIHDAP